MRRVTDFDQSAQQKVESERSTDEKSLLARSVLGCGNCLAVWVHLERR
jgi:hypothetical protein